MARRSANIILEYAKEIEVTFNPRIVINKTSLSVYDKNNRAKPNQEVIDFDDPKLYVKINGNLSYSSAKLNTPLKCSLKIMLSGTRAVNATNPSTMIECDMSIAQDKTFRIKRNNVELIGIDIFEDRIFWLMSEYLRNNGNQPEYFLLFSINPPFFPDNDEQYILEESVSYPIMRCLKFSSLFGARISQPKNSYQIGDEITFLFNYTTILEDYTVRFVIWEDTTKTGVYDRDEWKSRPLNHDTMIIKPDEHSKKIILGRTADYKYFYAVSKDIENRRADSNLSAYYFSFDLQLVKKSGGTITENSDYISVSQTQDSITVAKKPFLSYFRETNSDYGNFSNFYDVTLDIAFGSLAKTNEFFPVEFAIFTDALVFVAPIGVGSFLYDESSRMFKGTAKTSLIDKKYRPNKHKIGVRLHPAFKKDESVQSDLFFDMKDYVLANGLKDKYAIATSQIVNMQSFITGTTCSFISSEGVHVRISLNKGWDGYCTLKINVLLKFGSPVSTKILERVIDIIEPPSTVISELHDVSTVDILFIEPAIHRSKYEKKDYKKATDYSSGFDSKIVRYWRYVPIDRITKLANPDKPPYAGLLVSCTFV